MSDEGSPLARARAALATPTGQVITAVVAVAVIAAAVCIFIFGEDPNVQTVAERGFTVPYVCRGCGDSGEVKLEQGEKLPVPCPKCETGRIVQAFKCHKCGKLLPTANARIICPGCRTVHDHRTGAKEELLR